MKNPLWVPMGKRVGTSSGLRASSALPSASFLRYHLWWPLAAAGVIGVLVMASKADLWVADRLYAWEGGRWTGAHLVVKVIYLGGSNLSRVAWLGVVVAWLIARSHPRWARFREPLAYLALATLAGAVLVLMGKYVTNMDCPWDLLRYGGDRPYVGLFSSRPAGMPRGACFPAGHASAGYAWLSLCFFFRMVRPQLRWWGLTIGLASGLILGLAQQLRGAHFLSHDLSAAAVCWFTALGVYLAFRHARTKEGVQTTRG